MIDDELVFLIDCINSIDCMMNSYFQSCQCTIINEAIQY